METSGRKPTIVRIWRGRTRREVANDYEEYNFKVGIKRLCEHALAVQTFRHDRGDETEFVTISYWESIEAMSRYTGGDPRRIHHLPRDAEFLVRLPDSVDVFEIRHCFGIDFTGDCNLPDAARVLTP